MPAIHVPAASRVTKVERAGREVEVCALVGERVEHPRVVAVRELSFAPWQQVIGSVLIRHPAGDVILDPAFGRSIARDMERASPLTRLLLGDGRTKTPLVDVMTAAGLDPLEVRYAIATHVHWDHVGALGDLPNAKVLISSDELDWARTLNRWWDAGVMPHHLSRAKARTFRFTMNGPPAEGFERSFDLFGDGAIVAVPMPGHTPGHVAWLVKSAGKTWFFVGDTAWTLRGVELPAHKTAPVDENLELVAEQLGVLNAFLTNRPDVVIVPAHDGAAWEALPRCGSAGSPSP